ncbi:MAG: hypothetical protein AAF752_10715, partial [Bacteroidota bacterium]
MAQADLTARFSNVAKLSESKRQLIDAGMPARMKGPRGQTIELIGALDGQPVYYTTLGRVSAQSIGATQLWITAQAGYRLSGLGQRVALFDAGGVRDSHIELGNR